MNKYIDMMYKTACYRDIVMAERYGAFFFPDAKVYDLPEYQTEEPELTGLNFGELCDTFTSARSVKKSKR